MWTSFYIGSIILYTTVSRTIAHDEVIKWKHFPCYWPFMRGIHRSSVNSPHKSQWRGALVFSLICAWINASVNSGEAGDLRRHRAHYDVTENESMKNSCCSTGVEWVVNYLTHGKTKSSNRDCVFRLEILRTADKEYISSLDLLRSLERNYIYQTPTSPGVWMPVGHVVYFAAIDWPSRNWR